MFDGIIETRSGKLRGVDHDGLWVFKGIRYAGVPSSAMRWRAPQPVEPWTGVRTCDRYGPVAPQPTDGIGSYFPGDPETQSEDCCSLNIWAPRPEGPLLPVMCFIHGGAFLSGSGSSAMIDGSKLAARGVVVVTLNYRLGALGFLAHPALFDDETNGCGNWGLADQLAALTWLRDHIAAVGGDPNNVTLFGESAGAMSICDLLGVQPPVGDKRLFHRAIAESGPAIASSLSAGKAVAEEFARALGMSKVDREALIKIPVADIYEAQRAVTATVDEGIGMPFQPVIDGGLLKVHPAEAIAKGVGQDVDLLIGTNHDEFRIFTFAVKGLSTIGDQEVESIVGRYLAGAGIASSRISANDVLEAYRQARMTRGEPVGSRDLLEAIGGDWVFTIPAARLAASHATAGGQSFRYRFDWASPLMGGALGACHGIEMPFVFGTIDHKYVGLFSGSDAAAAQLSERVQAAWVAFASTGNPSCPEVGTWPCYENGSRSVMVLDRSCRVESNPDGPELDFWDKHLGSYGVGGPIEGAQSETVAHLAPLHSLEEGRSE